MSLKSNRFLSPKLITYIRVYILSAFVYTFFLIDIKMLMKFKWKVVTLKGCNIGEAFLKYILTFCH